MANVLIIGGTLFIGRELVRQVLQRGHHVTILHRNSRPLPRGVDEILCDRNDGEAMRRALTGRNFELVFDNVYDVERGTSADQVAAAAEACRSHLQRYVFLSSVAVYSGGLDRRETDPLASTTHPFPYTRHKAGTERKLFALHQAHGFPVVALRPSFVYGPENPYYREAFFWDRVLRDRPIIVPDDGMRLMQFVYVKDVAAAALRACEVSAAIGQAYNITHPKALTQADAVKALAAAAGKQANLVFIPRAAIERAGGGVFQPPFYFGEYLDLPPVTMQIDKAVRDLDFRPIEFEQGLAETYQWYLKRPPARLDFTFEDRLLQSAGRSS